MSMMNLAARRCVRSIGCRRNFSSSAVGSSTAGAGYSDNNVPMGFFVEQMQYLLSGFFIYTTNGVVTKFAEEKKLNIGEKPQRQQRCEQRELRELRLRSLLKID